LNSWLKSVGWYPMARKCLVYGGFRRTHYAGVFPIRL
jgi:hypothetical protein